MDVSVHLDMKQKLPKSAHVKYTVMENQNLYKYDRWVKTYIGLVQFQLL